MFTSIPPSFRIFLLIVFSIAARASEPIIIQGGLSPSKNFAVAIYTDKKADDLTENDDTKIYLIDARTHKKIGPLEEVSCDGGSWGTTTENVNASWTPDGRWLAVNFREGRMMHGYQLYEIQGRRAVPVKLSYKGKLRKGRVYDFTTTGANPGADIRMVSNTECTVDEYGLHVKDNAPDDTFDKLGLGGFDDSLEKVYQLSNEGKWVLVDIRVPKEK